MLVFGRRYACVRMSYPEFVAAILSLSYPNRVNPCKSSVTNTVGVMAGAVTLIVYFWIMTSKDNTIHAHLGAGPERVGQMQSFAITHSLRPPLTVAWRDANGQDVSLAALEKVVMLNFWASWCSPCLRRITINQSVAGPLGRRSVYRSRPQCRSRGQIRRRPVHSPTETGQTGSLHGPK